MVKDNTARGRLKDIILNGLSLSAPLLGAAYSIPIMLRHMTTESFALFGMYWVIIGYASIIELGMGRAVAWQLSFGKEKKIENEITILYTAISIGLIFGLIGSIIFYNFLPILFGKVIAVPKELIIENTKSIYFISFSAIWLVLASIFSGALEARQSFGQLAIARIPTGFAMFAAPALLSSWGYSLSVSLASMVAVRIVLVIVLGVFVFRKLPVRSSTSWFSMTQARSLMGFGGWITVSAIIGPLLVYMDRFIVSSVRGLNEAAIYTIPFEAVVRLLIVASAVSAVVFPKFVSPSPPGNQSTSRIYWEANAYIALALVPILIILTFWGKEVFAAWLNYADLAPSNLELIANLAVLIAAGVVVNGCAHIPQALIQARGFPSWTACLHVLEITLYLFYAPLIIESFGLYGAAVSWLIRASISAIALYAMAYKFLK